MHEVKNKSSVELDVKDTCPGSQEFAQLESHKLRNLYPHPRIQAVITRGHVHHLNIPAHAHRKVKNNSTLSLL